MAKKKKTPKPEPVLISSRAGMLAVVNDLVKYKLDHAALLVRIEKLKSRVTRKFQGDVDDLNRLIQMAEGGLHVWAASHPGEFDGKKSIELPDARFGFRTCPPKVDKVGGNWEQILARLSSVYLVDAQNDNLVLFDGSDYIRLGTPEIDKAKLLADRDKIPAEALQLAGILIVKDEVFFFEPKSELIEATTQEAA
ncbi:hypothetical protein BH09VER1_BH09VER1_24850 [soil metagenome]